MRKSILPVAELPEHELVTKASISPSLSVAHDVEEAKEYPDANSIRSKIGIWNMCFILFIFKNYRIVIVYFEHGVNHYKIPQ